MSPEELRAAIVDIEEEYKEEKQLRRDAFRSSCSSGARPHLR